jgi:hypothetical protein
MIKEYSIVTQVAITEIENLRVKAHAATQKFAITLRLGWKCEAKVSYFGSRMKLQRCYSQCIASETASLIGAQSSQRLNLDLFSSRKGHWHSTACLANPAAWRCWRRCAELRRR